MQVRKVVVTGSGSISPFGRGVDALMDGLVAGKSGVSRIDGLESIIGMRSFVGAAVPGIDGMEIPRRFRRSMPRMAIFATLASQEALGSAGISDDVTRSPRMGVSIGSTIGSPATIQAFFEQFLQGLGEPVHRGSVEVECLLPDHEPLLCGECGPGPRCHRPDPRAFSGLRNGLPGHRVRL